MIKGICKNCGKEYEYEPKKRSYKNWYCSIKCRMEFNKKNNQAQYRICTECGKKYWWEENQPNYRENGRWINSRLFCSYECGVKHWHNKVKVIYENWTEEERKAHIEKTKIGISKRTDEDKKQTVMKRQETCLKKYNATSWNATEEGKKHLSKVLKARTSEERANSLAKIRKTKLERYGCENYQNVKAIEKTMLARYGVTSYSKTQEYREKTRNTYFAKTGYYSPSQNPEVKEKKLLKYRSKSFDEKRQIVEKTKATLTERYGEDYAKKRAELSAETCMKKYGMKSILLPSVRGASRSIISKPNRRFAGLLHDKGIESIFEFPLARFSYDLKVGNTLIEINPTVTHFSTNTTVWHYKPKSPTYHAEKTQIAKENGYRCIHVWDWDDEEKVIELISPKEKVYARRLQLKEVSVEECKVFLYKYHLQNSCNGQYIRLGLYRDDELLEVMTFGKSRYSKKYEYELLRLCTKAGYSVMGGAERLFKYFLDTYKPKSVISYCDNAKFTGEVYTKLGMKLKSEGSPSRHWINVFTGRHITDNLLRQRGYSQLHKDTTHKKGESNELLMLEDGYLEMYDCGQSVYILEL